MDFRQFLEVLVEARQNGWISEVVCESHGGVPMTDEEMDLFEDGNDPCIFVFRLYDRPSTSSSSDLDTHDKSPLET